LDPWHSLIGYVGKMLPKQCFIAKED